MVTTRVQIDPTSEELDLRTEGSSLTSDFPIRDDAKAAFRAAADDVADDLVIALQVRQRLARAEDESYWTDAEDVIRDFGLDPADFGLGQI